MPAVSREQWKVRVFRKDRLINMLAAVSGAFDQRVSLRTPAHCFRQRIAVHPQELDVMAEIGFMNRIDLNPAVADGGVDGLV